MLLAGSVEYYYSGTSSFILPRPPCAGLNPSHPLVELCCFVCGPGLPQIASLLRKRARSSRLGPNLGSRIRSSTFPGCLVQVLRGVSKTETRHARISRKVATLGESCSTHSTRVAPLRTLRTLVLPYEIYHPYE